MSELASFVDYDGLRRALNEVRGIRQMPLSVMNDLAGCADGFFEKALGPRPGRHLGVKSLSDAFGVLGIRCVLVHDAEAWARIEKHSRRKIRDESHYQAVLRGGTTEIRLSRRHMSIIQAKGRTNRWSKMTPKQKAKWAKQMNKKRWGKVKSKSKEMRRRARQQRRTHKERKLGNKTGV